jgi:hypothetical protein
VRKTLWFHRLQCTICGIDCAICYTKMAIWH